FSKARMTVPIKVTGKITISTEKGYIPGPTARRTTGNMLTANGMAREYIPMRMGAGTKAIGRRINVPESEPIPGQMEGFTAAVSKREKSRVKERSFGGLPPHRKVTGMRAIMRTTNFTAQARLPGQVVIKRELGKQPAYRLRQVHLR